MAEKSITEHWAGIFLDEFSKESDRACVILSVAMLDRALESIIKARLVPIGSPEDSLLEGAYAPISTFRARIDLAHRLGLISTKLCRDLHIIRRIRNEFAHNVVGCSFDNSSVRSRIAELIRSSGIAARRAKTREHFLEGPKGDFQMMISWVLWHLWDLSGKINSIEPAKIEWGYTNIK